MSLSSKSAVTFAFQVLFMVLGGIVVVLRLIAKRMRGRPLYVHDVCCLLGYLFMVAFSIVYSIASFHGLGRHVDTLSVGEITYILKCFYASEFMYNSATIFLRLSILLLYLVLFPQKHFKYFAYPFGALLFLFPFGSILYLFGFCRPISKMWRPSEPGHCGSNFAVELVSASVNMVFDLILILMPMPIVWRLRMSTKKKFAVTSVFCVSLANIGINIGRVLEPLITDFDDFTYSTAPNTVLVTAELLTGLLVSCIPTFGPLFRFRGSQKDAEQPRIRSVRILGKVPKHPDPLAVSVGLETSSSKSATGDLFTVYEENSRSGHIAMDSLPT